MQKLVYEGGAGEGRERRKGGREKEDERRKGWGRGSGLAMAGLIFLHRRKFVLFQLCLHSPADDGSGVDLDGLLALTGRE